MQISDIQDIWYVTLVKGYSIPQRGHDLHRLRTTILSSITHSGGSTPIRMSWENTDIRRHIWKVYEHLFIPIFMFFQAGSRGHWQVSAYETNYLSQEAEMHNWDNLMFFTFLQFSQRSHPPKARETILLSLQPVSIELSMAANETFQISSFILGTIAQIF